MKIVTRKFISVRQVEHWEQHKVRAFRLEHVEKSALAEHVKELDQTIALDEASVLCNEVDGCRGSGKRHALLNRQFMVLQTKTMVENFQIFIKQF